MSKTTTNKANKTTCEKDCDRHFLNPDRPRRSTSEKITIVVERLKWELTGIVARDKRSRLLSPSRRCHRGGVGKVCCGYRLWFSLEAVSTHTLGSPLGVGISSCQMLCITLVQFLLIQRWTSNRCSGCAFCCVCVKLTIDIRKSRVCGHSRISCPGSKPDNSAWLVLAPFLPWWRPL